MTGQPLIKAMAASGLTVPALAELLVVSTETVSSWRMDRRSPCCRLMEAELARVLSEALSRSKMMR